jgi:hypothetical protein
LKKWRASKIRKCLSKVSKFKNAALAAILKNGWLENKKKFKLG